MFSTGNSPFATRPFATRRIRFYLFGYIWGCWRSFLDAEARRRGEDKMIFTAGPSGPPSQGGENHTKRLPESGAGGFVLEGLRAQRRLAY
jgi:hypothetical protein